MGFGDRLGVSLGVVKTSVFVAKIDILELSQVPLVSAKFRVKWSFKHATNLSHFDLSDATDEAKRLLHPHQHHLSPSAQKRRLSVGSKADSSNRDSAEESSNSSRLSPTPTPTCPLSPPRSPFDPRTPNPNRTPTPSFGFTNPFGADAESPPAGASPSPPPPPSAVLHSRSTTDSAHSSSDTPPHRRGATVSAHNLVPHPPRSEPKGTTSLIPLRAHTATFKREIQCPVAIPLKSLPASARYQLQPCPLRLAIRQEVNVDAGGKKEEVKTGEVVLDLSQFVGNGHNSDGAPRRYLLQDCKTNATLRVAVKMEWVGGERDFVAPPLKSGQLSSSATSVHSTSSFGKSSVSLNSKKLPTAPNPSVPMSRTNSSSSVSIASSKSASIISSDKKPRGWHPGASNGFSSSPSPTLLGGTTNSNGQDRSAFDIIDTIFNRPERKSSWFGGFHQQPDPAPFRQHPPSSDNSLNFSVGPRGGRPPNLRSPFNGLSRAEQYGGRREDEHGDGWFKVASAAGLQAPRLGRRLSSASTQSRSARSVRWDDDAPPALPSPVGRKESGSSSANLVRLGEGEGEDADDKAREVEERSARDSKLVGVDEGLHARKGVVGEQSAKVVVRDKEERNDPPEPSPGLEGRVSSRRQGEWAKSWG